MHHPIPTDPSPTAARLHAAYLARRAKEAAAARRVQTANQNAPARKLVAVEKEEPPEWKAGVRFNYHERLWLEWKIAQIAKVKNHIATRCAERGLAVDDIKSRSKRDELVEFRDTLVYEIKTEVDPAISWEQLARHFGRDHTSIITAYDRGAAAAGDPVAIERVKKRRQEASRRFQASKGKSK